MLVSLELAAVATPDLGQQYGICARLHLSVVFVDWRGWLSPAQQLFSRWVLDVSTDIAECGRQRHGLWWFVFDGCQICCLVAWDAHICRHFCSVLLLLYPTSSPPLCEPTVFHAANVVQYLEYCYSCCLVPLFRPRGHPVVHLKCAKNPLSHDACISIYDGFF